MAQVESFPGNSDTGISGFQGQSANEIRQNDREEVQAEEQRAQASADADRAFVEQEDRVTIQSRTAEADAGAEAEAEVDSNSDTGVNAIRRDREENEETEIRADGPGFRPPSQDVRNLVIGGNNDNSPEPPDSDAIAVPTSPPTIIDTQIQESLQSSTEPIPDVNAQNEARREEDAQIIRNERNEQEQQENTEEQQSDPTSTQTEIGQNVDRLI